MNILLKKKMNNNMKFQVGDLLINTREQSVTKGVSLVVKIETDESFNWVWIHLLHPSGVINRMAETLIIAYLQTKNTHWKYFPVKT